MSARGLFASSNFHQSLKSARPRADTNEPNFYNLISRIKKIRSRIWNAIQLSELCGRSCWSQSSMRTYPLNKRYRVTWRAETIYSLQQQPLDRRRILRTSLNFFCNNLFILERTFHELPAWTSKVMNDLVDKIWFGVKLSQRRDVHPNQGIWISCTALNLVDLHSSCERLQE